MAFWNRNDDYRRRDWREMDRDRDSRREEQQRYGVSSVRELGYGGEGMGMPTERGPNDRGDWARDRYGTTDHRGEDRFGYGRHERERGYEGRPMDNRDERGSFYGSADYGIGLGGWREQGRAMMDAPRQGDRGYGTSDRERLDDRRYRSDMPGMHARGDYGMDDYRRRGMGNDDYGRGWSRPAGMITDDGYSQMMESSRGRAVMGGRGPRSYVRSDDRIREDVCERLMQSWMNAEDVDVRVENGEVTLTGLVDSRYEKRSIEDVVEGVLGVKEVHNQMRVRPQDNSAGTSTRSGQQPATTDTTARQTATAGTNRGVGTGVNTAVPGNGTPARS